MGKFSNNLGKRVLNKGPKIGYCVICGEYGKLSRDHVPPRKCNNLSDVELKALFSKEQISKVGTISQGGAHYRTICSECNSTHLGTKYDPALVDLSNDITSYVMAANNRLISLPEVISPFVKPQKIARSVVGHCLAAIAIEETKTGLVSSPISDSLREYFLNESLPMPKELDIYYWLYPSKRQVVVKNMGKSSMNGNGTIFGHVIKFLPLGFWLVWNKPKTVDLKMRSLLSNKNIGINEVEQHEINLYDVPALDFPEAPADHEFIALNSNYAVVADKKK